MSWRKTITVWCDSCDEVVSSGHLGDETVGEARAAARHDGAHTGLPGSRDLCADCWNAGER